ncbi:28S ribosomal protein S5, mitochondrial [Chytriomyces hyalinus]|nr:28S ribosomal protein S5, mitochondrial [Chytriomyces hyalinus]
MQILSRLAAYTTRAGVFTRGLATATEGNAVQDTVRVAKAAPRKVFEGSNPTKGRPAASASASSSMGSNANKRREDGSKKEQLQKRVLHIRSVARSTKGGKIRSSSAIVVVGNGNGVGGYGEGRAADASGAIAKATAMALKNMVTIPRFQQRTVFGDIMHRYHSVTVDIKAASPGFGIVASNHIHEICRCVGIRDMAAKVRGSLNPINVIKATFEALQSQKTPVEIAQARGRKLVDIADAYYGGKL